MMRAGWGQSRLSLTMLKHWIFDLDGTLTVAAHDFDEIRRRLGLAGQGPILEALDAMPEARAAPLRQQLAQWELAIARRSRAQPHARAARDAQGAQGAGRHPHAQQLAQCRGDARRRPPARVLRARRRDHARLLGAQPARRHQALLQRWQASPAHAVMVGDYLFDLQAGRAAGVITVHLDVTGANAWPEHADHRVESLAELRALLLDGTGGAG
ncbi:MAG: HAD family hydrolase [Planctomycetota bacterium]